MNYLGYIIPPLSVALIMLIINRIIIKRDRAKIKDEKDNEILIRIESRMDGIESMANTLSNVKERITAREIICENNHRWDGRERRTVTT